ncbi:MAG: HAD family hydrolase [Oscillospiraceae bacterium]|nr:HAD family hydrolase [Oscillospiraceae bacterium]
MKHSKCARIKKMPECFLYEIRDIISDPFVRQLRNYSHHRKTNRLCHSLNVSYYSWKACKALKLDSKSAARGAMLHDLYLYNRREYIREYGEAFHASRHPRLAFINAVRRFKINSIEADCILCHMFPSTLRIPRYGESFVVSIVDKFCAVLEFIGFLC